MDTPKHVIHIPRRFVQQEWGGTETFITEVSLRMRDRGYSPVIMTTKALEQQSPDQYRGIPITRHGYFYPYLGLRKRNKEQLDRKAGNLFSWSLMFSLLRKDVPVDILHLHTGKRLGGIVRLCAKLRKVPYVVSLHGGYLAVPSAERDTWTNPTRHTLEWGKFLGFLVGSRHVLDDAAAIICVGREEFDAMSSRYPRKRVVHLPNGVDLGRYSQGDGAGFRNRFHIPSHAFVILSVARIDEQKNQLALIRHLPQILAKVPHAHLLLIGPSTNPTYREKVSQEMENLDVGEHVTLLHGFPYGDPELVNAYHSADCFALPSLHEPFGMVVLEAWASHVPVVVSHVGGLKHLVEDGVDGLSIDPEAPTDSPQGLAGALTRLAASEEYRHGLAERGYRKTCARYSWDHITDELISIYRSVYESTVR